MLEVEFELGAGALVDAVGVTPVEGAAGIGGLARKARFAGGERAGVVLAIGANESAGAGSGVGAGAGGGSLRIGEGARGS